MIQRVDVEQTLRAWDPDVTKEQIDTLYETMQQAWQDRVGELEMRTMVALKERTGPLLDGPTMGSLRRQAQQLADDQIKGEYLEPITQQIVQQNLEDEEEDTPHLKALRDPDGWRKTPWAIQVSQEVKDVAWELWEDEDAEFTHLAETLLERRLFLGLPIPNRPEHPDYPEVVSQARDAALYWKQRRARHDL